MVKLVPYDAFYEAVTLNRISNFFSFHKSLVQTASSGSVASNADTEDSRLTLNEWQMHPNALFVIINDEASAGFVRINYRGPNVAWIEDIFVDAAHRGCGIASAAIASVEDIIMNTPGYTAVCLDVSPRNENALRLYHNLGYTDLSLITIRKEFGNSQREKPIRLLGLDFKY